MATYNLPGGLKIERTLAYRGSALKAKVSGKLLSSSAVDPEPALEEKVAEVVEEKVAEVEEEAVKPKARRGRPKKKADADS